MSKIIEALNTMIANRDKISDATEDRIFGGYEFRYLGKRWSVHKQSGGIVIVKFHPEGEENRTVDYGEDEWTSREARETFRDLYRTVQERSYQVDKVLDEIIEGNPLLSTAGR